MSKLNAMHIHNFRGLTDVSMNGFSEVNLFVGDNNTGKTSLLEAIYLIANYSTKSGFLRLARMRERNSVGINQTISTEELISWLFNKTVKPIEIAYDFNGDSNSIRCTLEEEKYILLSASSDGSLDREQIVKDQVIKINDGKLNQDEIIKHEFISSVKKPPLPIKVENGLFACHFISAIDHKVAPISPDIIDDLVKQGERPVLLEALRQFDKNVNGIELLMSNDQNNSRAIPYIQHEDLGLVPISMFGDGMRKALVIAAQVVRFKNGILLIDEIETGIHTKHIPTFFTWLTDICQQHNIQLFATTHSLEALDGMLKAKEKNTKQLSVYRLGDENEKNQVKYFSGEKLKVLRYELGQDVR